MKPDYQIKNVKLYNCDCMEFMKDIPDNFYDLAIVDPPYGIGAGKDSRVGGEYTVNLGGKKKKVKATAYTPKEWDNKPPEKPYFDEITRISKQQIIWGANHFISKMPFDSSAWIVWDKDNGDNNNADCELAWTSFKLAVRKVKFKWNGFLQEDMKNKEIRLHPTQKPVQLYKWILSKYAKKGDKIFDSHGGSFSSACACLDMGFEFDGCEIDQEYFQNAVERLKNNVQEYLNF